MALQYKLLRAEGRIGKLSQGIHLTPPRYLLRNPVSCIRFAYGTVTIELLSQSRPQIG